MSSVADRALKQGFSQIYPGEVARLLNDLPIEELLIQLKDLSASTISELFVRMNKDKAVELILHMEEDSFRRLFTNIDPSYGAMLLAMLDENGRATKLSLLPAALASEYGELILYPPDTAGHLMDSRVTTVACDDKVGDVLKRIRLIKGRHIIDVCVVSGDGRLVALVPLQDIAIALPKQRISEIIKGEPVSIDAMAPREDIVRLLDNMKMATLPVVDTDGRLLGVIRHEALVTAAQHEMSEDLVAMFGAGKDERALSKVSFAVSKRLPWLMVNLATAFLAAAVVGLFEDTIARITILAVMLPVVAGQSGNTGSQALAVTMRGLALREIRPRHWPRVVRKEMLAGFINGCAIAMTTSVAVYLWTRSAGLVAVIAAAMIFSMFIAGTAGVIIPVVLKKFGFDPAQSSSIILTTVTDVVGFMSFLGLATLLSGFIHMS